MDDQHYQHLADHSSVTSVDGLEVGKWKREAKETIESQLASRIGCLTDKSIAASYYPSLSTLIHPCPPLSTHPLRSGATVGITEQNIPALPQTSIRTLPEDLLTLTGLADRSTKLQSESSFSYFSNSGTCPHGYLLGSPSRKMIELSPC